MDLRLCRPLTLRDGKSVTESDGARGHEKLGLQVRGRLPVLLPHAARDPGWLCHSPWDACWSTPQPSYEISGQRPLASLSLGSSDIITATTLVKSCVIHNSQSERQPVSILDDWTNKTCCRHTAGHYLT